MITLENSSLVVEIDPDRGAEVSSVRLNSKGLIDVLLPSKRDQSMLGGVQVMLPWVNRVSRGGFSYGGQFHALVPNVSSEPFPIHGSAFQQNWTVLQCGHETATLELISDVPPPFSYVAEYKIALEGTSLLLKMRVTNRAPRSLPFSFGFHPWFRRSRSTLLTARCRSVWLEDERYLPTHDVEIAPGGAFDFSNGAMLSDDWVNNCMTGWDGLAMMRSPELGLAVRMEVSGMSCLHLYSPNSQANFVCVEPVTSIPDSVNRIESGHAGSAIVLEPSEEVAFWCRITPASIEQAQPA